MSQLRHEEVVASLTMCWSQQLVVLEWPEATFMLFTVNETNTAVIHPSVLFFVQ